MPPKMKTRIKVIDDFLPKIAFKDLQEYCQADKFEIVSYSNKKFSVITTPNAFLPFLKLEGYDMILTFIRSAYEGFDEEINIHADGLINGQKVDKAAVLYINDPEGVTPNGTQFYSHQTHGRILSADTPIEEQNRLLEEDSNNVSAWMATDSIVSIPNRLLRYESNMFHSKVPAKIKKGTRIVLVAFYKKINRDL
jgi:hypothetical protein